MHFSNENARLKSWFFILIITLMATCQVPEKEETSEKNDLTTSEYRLISQVDYGTPVGMMMTIYKTTMIADSLDSTRVRVAVIDSLERQISTTSTKFRIYLQGNARITTMDGSVLPVAVDTAGLEYMESKLNNGLAYFKFYAGQERDTIKLEVKSEGLWSASHEIHTIPKTVNLLQPSAQQIIPTTKEIDPMIGADISFLPQIEARGRKFYENGKEIDAIRLLNTHGFNYIRLRIFVNPENEDGYAPGEGYCGLDYTLGMAKRVKEAGMKLLLNFHYSDYWADPQKQIKPKNWENLDFQGLKEQVSQYTTEIVRALSDQGTPPDMVQVGNEINHGILWPEGHISNPDQLAELLKAGVAGVEQVDPSIPVMMHVALGGQNQEAVFWFDNMIARGVTFDLIGLSYYSRWHGTLDDLKFNLNDLLTRYGKPINVVEYNGYKEQVNDMVLNLPGNMGNGTCIWEPLGARSRLFDREGNVKDLILLYEHLNRTFLQETLP